jgi:hypothetical protein
LLNVLVETYEGEAFGAKLVEAPAGPPSTVTGRLPFESV